MTESTLTEKRIGDLWMLLLRDPRSLSDQEIEDLLARKKELEDILFSVKYAFPYQIKSVRGYRKRKRELAGKSTEELQKMYREILDERGRIMRETPDEELPDRFFEPAPIDSDSYIIPELLKERGA